MFQGPLSLCILRLLSLKSNQQVFAFWSICKSKCLMKNIWQNAFLVAEVTVLQNAPGCLSQEVDIIWGWRCHYDNLPSIDFIWIFMITSCPIPRVSSTSWEKVKRISSTFVYGNPMSDIYFYDFSTAPSEEVCAFTYLFGDRNEVLPWKRQVWKSERSRKQKTLQELRMLSLSLFFQGSLWMMRLFFSIARNVISALWGYP